MSFSEPLKLLKLMKTIVNVIPVVDRNDFDSLMEAVVTFIGIDTANQIASIGEPIDDQNELAVFLVKAFKLQLFETYNLLNNDADYRHQQLISAIDNFLLHRHNYAVVVNNVDDESTRAQAGSTPETTSSSGSDDSH
ncbi:uncharacterized protein LOC128957778 [Oppia nitens]|uniref:uncharacterized protein LOC128957778 n=1 Tax=Oppia nitens TaxID=1686743 RepID=UPI0023DC6446|nr:uncharacterized protein LOC128957778 [Oppia nitens]